MRIFTHGDGDGVCSAALVKHLNPEAEVWFAKPASLHRYLSELQGEDRVYILDIALNERFKNIIFPKLEELSKSGEVIYIDHHPLPLDIFKRDVPGRFIHEVGVSTSELTFRLLEAELPAEMDRVALWGALSDYCEETRFVCEHLSKYDRRTIYLEAGLLTQALTEADFDYKRRVVEELARGRSPVEIEGMFEWARKATERDRQIWEYVKRNVQKERNLAIVYALDTPLISSGGKAAFYALGVTDADVGMCILRKGDEMDISMRRRAGVRINLDLLLRKTALRFGGSGGGHEGAAGARVPQDKFEAFMETLKREISPILPKDTSLRR